MRNIELIIFDCDGVLVDSEVITGGIMAEDISAHGFSMTAHECLSQFIGMTMADVRENAISLGADLPADWVEKIYVKIYERLGKGCPLIAGVPELLDALDAVKLDYCVASNGSLKKMDITLGQNNILARFGPRVYSAQELGTAKPAPDLFWHAAGELSPDRCVVIEDSLLGMRAARAAGMRCFAYAPEGNEKAMIAEGATPFQRMADLPALLGLGNLHVAGTGAALDSRSV